MFLTKRRVREIQRAAQKAYDDGALDAYADTRMNEPVGEWQRFWLLDAQRAAYRIGRSHAKSEDYVPDGSLPASVLQAVLPLAISGWAWRS